MSSFRGAGGTEGGVLRFFIGLVMLIAGGYLFLEAIHVDHRFGMGSRMFGIGGVSITSGYVMIPFIFGIGMVFYNTRNYIGWFLVLASLIMLIFGVIVSSEFRFVQLTAFRLIMILILMIGGLGLSLSSFKHIKGHF